MDKYFLPKYIIIALAIIAVVLGGVLIWQLGQRPVPVTEGPPPTAPGGQIVFQPWSETAEKYYPGGGNAIDFRDGAEGDFEVELSRKGEKVVLNWPAEIKVIEVKLYNLGTLWNLQDHSLVFTIGTFDITKPPLPPATGTQPLIPDQPFPEPKVFLKSPYEIGQIPEGFFDNTFYTEEFPEGSVIFQKGARYSVELYGINPEGKYLSGYYTFNYE